MVVSQRKKRSGILAPGDRIGDYEIIEKIGQGGIAEIYRGRQASLDREVAIKLLTKSSTAVTEIVRCFEQEAKIIAKLRHPNIVHVIDRGIDQRGYYFVMDYIEGENFQEILSRRKCSPEQNIEIVVNVLKALDYAHKNGVIHRDVKPSNILIDRQGFVMVVDFGIAQILDDKAGDRTDSGLVMGTLAYMSPEQKLPSCKVDHTTDLYAVGVILYEIMTKKKPTGSFEPPSSVNSDIAPRFDEIVMKCLKQNPKDRYQTAVELKDDLLSALNAKSPIDSPANMESGSLTENLIGNCSFLDTIKESPFGATYLVENRVDGNLYVIKKIVNRGAGLREARILAKLDHSHILKIHGAGGDTRRDVLLTEYAQGGSLADRLVKPYPAEEAIVIFRQIATGLSFAHKNNIIHGNLRPSNILFDHEDNVKLSDFGLPGHYSQQKDNWYASPDRKKDKASDLYSSGVILYQLLTNRLPQFDSHDRLEWPPMDAEIPATVSELTDSMLRKKVFNRVSSFEEVLAKIDDCEEELAYGLKRRKRRRNLSKGKRYLRILIPLFVVILIMTALVLLDVISLDDLRHLSTT